MQAVADDIHAVGWSVSGVLGDEIAPPWAYTIGLWLSHQGPELTMFGLPVEHMTIILNSIGERVANGAVIVLGRHVNPDDAASASLLAGLAAARYDPSACAVHPPAAK